MKVEFVKPQMRFNPVMMFTGYAFAVWGGLMLWFFHWMELTWLALYFGGGTIVAAALMIGTSFYDYSEKQREETYKNTFRQGNV